MRIGLDSVTQLILILCALTMATLAVYHERHELRSTSARIDQRSVMIQSWRDLLEKGERLGPADAPVRLVEFSDFECPFCAEFEKDLKPLRQKYPTQLGVTYVHFPIPGHRFAVTAARAAECAGEQGRFEAMHNKLFEQQDQFGLKPWADIAKDAAVPNIPVFEGCIRRTDIIPRVVEGQALGKALDIQGTPTVIINGWKLGLTPTADELEGMVKAILAGKSPVTSDGKLAK